MIEKYRIIYVDETDEEIRRFQNYASADFDVVAMKPLPALDQMVELIMAEKFDAIISDYKLKEGAPEVTYDGIELVQKIEEIRENFPCFVLTSYDGDAAQEADDVNLVYVRDVLKQKDGLTFKERIRLQILKYVTRVSEMETEIKQLIAKKRAYGLEFVEEKRLAELDSSLEKTICKTCSLPAEMKEPTYLKKMTELLDATKILIESVRGKDAQN
jgi:DNA-binding NarL/FixJ family response regulator